MSDKIYFNVPEVARYINYVKRLNDNVLLNADMLTKRLSFIRKDFNDNVFETATLKVEEIKRTFKNFNFNVEEMTKTISTMVEKMEYYLRKI